LDDTESSSNGRCAKKSVFFYLIDDFLKGKKECFWSNQNATCIFGFGFKLSAWN